MKLRTTLIVGAIIRIVMMPFFGHPFDTWAWYGVAVGIVQGSSYIHFPPMWYYTLIPFAYLYDWASRIFPIKPVPISSIPQPIRPEPQWGITVAPGLLFNTVVKIPFLISDLIIAVMLYKIIIELTRNEKVAGKAAAILLLNPYLIWISIGWGMYDSLPALFSIAAIFFLLKKRIGLSALCLSIATVYSIYPIIFFIPMIIYLWKTGAISVKRNFIVTFTAIYFAVSLLLFAPTFERFLSFSGAIISSVAAGATPYTETAPGLTYWSIILVVPSMVSFAPIVLAISEILLVSIVYFKALKMKAENSVFDLVKIELLCLLAIYLSQERISEPFFVWALPFIVLVCVGDRRQEIIYWTLSFIALTYSVINAIFPLYLLSVSPWIGDFLVNMMHALSFTHGYIGAYILVILGSSFSILTVVLFLETLLKPQLKTPQ